MTKQGTQLPKISKHMATCKLNSYRLTHQIHTTLLSCIVSSNTHNRINQIRKVSKYVEQIYLKVKNTFFEDVEIRRKKLIF